MNKTVSNIGLCAAFLILLPAHPAQADDASTMPATATTQAAAETTTTEVKPADTSTHMINVSEKNLAKIKAIFPGRSKLRAVISEDDEFPQLPDSLEPGNKFDASQVEAMFSSENHWYEVPKWFAGEFSYGDTRTYYQKDFATGKVSYPNEFLPAVKSGRTRGAIVDKKGNIWHLSRKKEILDASNPDEKDYFRFEDEILGFILSPKEYAESSEGIEFYTDQGKIKDVMRYQRIRDFQLQPDGTVAADVSEMKFDLAGKPLFLTKAKGPMTKQKEFEAIGPKTEIVGGTYADVITLLRQHMERVNKLSDAPDPI